MLFKALVQGEGLRTVHTSSFLNYTPTEHAQDLTPNKTESPCLQCFAYL